jgi:hypothetical protein
MERFFFKICFDSFHLNFFFIVNVVMHNFDVIPEPACIHKLDIFKYSIHISA